MPERSCLVCRQRTEKSRLIRFVCHNGAIVVDRNKCMTGRGAYLHKDCLIKAHQQDKVWVRALRATVSLSQIKDLLREVLKEIENEQNQNL